jgi:hypothetical protein
VINGPQTAIWRSKELMRPFVVRERGASCEVYFDSKQALWFGIHYRELRQGTAR